MFINIWARVNPFSVLVFPPRLVTLVTLVTLVALWRLFVILLGAVGVLLLFLLVRTLGCWLCCRLLHSGDEKPWNRDGNNGKSLRG